MRVYACHKPSGITCDLSITAPDRVSKQKRRYKDMKAWFNSIEPDLRHIGRLDKPTTGLLLAITHGKDSGIFTRKILDPLSITKTYLARVKCGTSTFSSAKEDYSTSALSSRDDPHGKPDRDQITQLLSGIELSDGVAYFDSVKVVERRTRTFKNPKCQELTHVSYEANVLLTIRMGRNRIVRRTLAAVGLPVIRLTRVAIGNLHLDQLNIPQSFDSVLLSEDQIKLILGKPSEKRGTKRARQVQDGEEEEDVGCRLTSSCKKSDSSKRQCDKKH